MVRQNYWRRRATLSRVNILKRVKIGARWKLLSIPRNDKGNPNWAALPEGRYFIEWYLGGKRRREFGGTTVAQALVLTPL